MHACAATDIGALGMRLRSFEETNGPNAIGGLSEGFDPSDPAWAHSKCTKPQLHPMRLVDTMASLFSTAP